MLRFGSAPEVQGKAAIREALGHGHARHEMAHTFRNVWTVGDSTICEFAVRYTMRDDGRSSSSRPWPSCAGGNPTD